MVKKTKAELIEEIALLCKTFPQVKEYYQAQGANIQDIAKKYKDLIQKEFIGSKTRPPQARASVARKALNDFKKLTNEPDLIADVMMTYVESLVAFNTEYAPDVEDYYVRAENMFETVLALIQKHQMTEQFQLRAYDVMKYATEGWGHQESLEERYQEIYDRRDHV